jgi:hypothetical protein
MKTKLHRRSLLALASVVGIYLAGGANSLVMAASATYQFEAELVEDPDGYPFVVGQRVSGSYTFDLATPATTFPTPNTSTLYFSAATFQLTSLTAVPEPGTWAMLATLLATLSFFGWHRSPRP